MFKTTGSWLPEQPPPWESYTSQNCMIASVEHRLCGFLPASNSGLNGSGFSGFPEGGLGHKADGLRGKSAPRSQIPHFTHLPFTPNEYIKEHTSMFPAKFDEVLPTINEAPFPQQKKFLIFDQCGDDTRLMYNSLQPRYTPQTKHAFWSHLVEEGKPNENEQVLDEASGENETVDEGSEMREDTEEINALLYSDDDDFDAECDGESDDEVSTGHSPWANQENDFDQEVASLDGSSKRQKALDGGHIQPPLLWATKPNPSYEKIYEKMYGGDSICAHDEEANTTIRNKRLRKDNIHDTLRVLESIIPGLKSKDPVFILDEAINYLKSLKSNAETMCMEDPDESSCYGPSK